MKTCSGCKLEQPYALFFKSPTHKDGYHGVCRACRYAQRKARGRRETPEQHRKWSLKSAYGMTLDEYAGMVAAQGGSCQICQEPPGESSKWILHVDHCHATGRIRGLLCSPCNIAIGLLKDSPLVIERAKQYLVRDSKC